MKHPAATTGVPRLMPATAAPPPRPAPDELLRRYVANLSALYRGDPGLAARIDALPFSACPALEATRDGAWTARRPADDGRPLWLHSRHQPLAEARRFTTAQREAPPDAGDAAEHPSDQRCFFISGLALGYHVAALEEQVEQPRLIVAEDDLALIKAALCVVDLSRPLTEGRLVFLASADKGQVHAALRPLSTELLLGLRFITLPHTARCHAAFHAEVRRLLLDFITFARLQMMTLLRNARITVKNVLFNLPAYLARPGVEVLAGRAAGYPAILVAAGPSLARNIGQLAGLRDRAVLIAVQTVFKTLLARGVPPHFVTSLDFNEISAQFFHGIADVGETILVAEPKVTWHVLDAFPGRAHVLYNELYDNVLRSAAPRRGGLKPGSTVAHLAFYLAEHLGCDPIILVGQDLAFSEGLYYPPGMPIEQLWGPELNRFYTLEMKQWERIACSRPILRRVADIHGRDAYTDEQLFTYAEQFQSDFAATPARVVHACEGGMRLRGAEIMTLRDAAARCCARRLPPDLFHAGAEPAPAELGQRALPELRARLEEVRTLRDIAAQMRPLLEELLRLLDRPDDFNRVVARVDALRLRIGQYEQTYRLVTSVSQLAELRRYSCDRRIGAPRRETPEVARRRLQRDREFVAAFIDGCEYLAGLLPQAIARLERGRP